MSRRLPLLALVLTTALASLACQATPPPSPTPQSPVAAPPSPARSPTTAVQAPPPPTQRPPASGGGTGRDLGSPVAAGGGGAIATVAIPKPAVTLVPREPPPPFVPGAEPPSGGVANPIGPYTTPVPKPAGLTAAGGTGTGGAGAGGTGTGGAGGGIAIATTGPVTQLQPLAEIPLPPTPTVLRIDPGSGGGTTKR